LGNASDKKNTAFIIDSNNKYKIYWDVFIILILLFVCAVLPFRITFSKRVEETTGGWEIAYYIMDSLFFVDIVLTFFTSISDSTGAEQMTEITDKK
jgi:hypothetical protein